MKKRAKKKVIKKALKGYMNYVFLLQNDIYKKIYIDHELPDNYDRLDCDDKLDDYFDFQSDFDKFGVTNSTLIEARYFLKNRNHVKKITSQDKHDVNLVNNMSSLMASYNYHKAKQKQEKSLAELETEQQSKKAIIRHEIKSRKITDPYILKVDDKVEVLENEAQARQIAKQYLDKKMKSLKAQGFTIVAEKAPKTVNDIFVEHRNFGGWTVFKAVDSYGGVAVSDCYVDHRQSYFNDDDLPF